MTDALVGPAISTLGASSRRSDGPIRDAYAEGLLTEHGLSVRWDNAPCSTSERADAPTADERAAVDGDVRVAELVELLEAGAAVTGAHAAALFGCSARTGRRLLTRAQTLTTPAPAGELVGAGWPR